MPTGILTTSDLTVGVKIDMDDVIYVVSPLDSPMINGLDADGAVILGTEPTSEIEYFNMDEELLVPRSAASGAHLATDAFVQLANDAERLKFSTGDVLMAASSDELIRVTGYSATAGRLNVTRGFAGTAAEAITAGQLIKGLGTALAEGSDPEDARARDRATDSNFTQIFGPTAVHLSATEQVVAKYGVANEFQHQIFNRTRENVISREQAFLYGKKFNDPAAKVRTTGGLVRSIVTNVDSTSTQLTVLTVEGLMQRGYDKGGIGDILAANPAALGDLNALNDTGRVRVDVADSRRGRQRVMAIHTEYGDVTVVRNRYLDKSDAILWTREQVKRRVLRGFTMERLAKTGDSDKVQLVCEEGLQVKGEEHCGRFNALAY